MTNKNHYVLEQLKSDGLGSGLWQQCKRCYSNFQTAHMRMDCLCDACRPQPTPHTPEELAIIDEEYDARTPWDKLLQSPGIIECDLADVWAHIEDSLANGDFPEIPGISNCRLSDALSGQFDEENSTLLLAGNDAQILLSLEEQENLFHELYARRDARYTALHQE